MQVTNTATAVDKITAANPLETPGTSLPVDALANKETFLKLLVAQIKNQDPLQPTDGIQFVTQLAQFSQLEQLIGIRGDLDALNTTTVTDPTILP